MGRTAQPESLTKNTTDWGYTLKPKSRSYRAKIRCGSFCFLFAVSPRVCRQFHSTLFHSRRGAFLPAVFVAAVLPGFSGKVCLFCRKGVLWPEKSAEMRFRPFILPFLTAFTMFFIKKTLQTNFKNLLYNYKFNFFTQTFSYRFVWGSWVCAFRTASALR